MRSDVNVRTMKSSNLKQSSEAEPPTLFVFAFFGRFLFISRFLFLALHTWQLKDTFYVELQMT